MLLKNNDKKYIYTYIHECYNYVMVTFTQCSNIIYILCVVFNNFITLSFNIVK